MTETADETRTPPLFYRDLHPLSLSQHGTWRLKSGNLDFAAKTPFAPILVSELAAAARHYPVVFSIGDTVPVAVLGLEQANLFVTDGQWAPDTYVPAYVRRYPFGFIATTDPGQFVLGIDAASERVVRAGDDGVPLFEDEKPSALTQEALKFCDAYQGDAVATREFCQALEAAELLVDRHADATLPDGRKLGVKGFQIIDEQKFAELSAETVIEWHVKGWLALVHFHLASLQCFSALLSRQNARAGVSAGATASESPADAGTPAQSAKKSKKAVS